MKIVLGIIFCCLCWNQAHAAGVEAESLALIQKHSATEAYHARLCVRLAAFALHEQKEGDWVDAWSFLRLAREHDRKTGASK